MKRRDFLLSTAALGSLALVDTVPPSGLAAGRRPTCSHRPPAPSRWSKGASIKPVRWPNCSSTRWSSARQTTSPSRCTRRASIRPIRCVVADQPWEGWRIEIYGNVIFDHEEQLFKMWYIGESPAYFPAYAALYATSTDGIHWQKPLVGTIEARIARQAQRGRRRHGLAQRLQRQRTTPIRPAATR